MNVTTTLEPFEDEVDLGSLMWVICLGSIVVCFIIAGCYLCYKNNQQDKAYIAWVKAKSRGDPLV